MQTHFGEELSELKQVLLNMASRAERAVRLAVEAVVKRDHELALSVNSDDEVLDRFEVEIDEKAIVLLAKAPLASDLRLITVAMKVSQNLERVGDEAAKIAKRARDLSQEPPLGFSVDVPRLADLAVGQLKDSLDAFVQADAAVARSLIPRDKEINRLNKDIQRELVARMMERPDNITRCLQFMVVSKSLERIADHAKNVAEEVVYLCEAQDIRHTKNMRAASSA